MHRAESQLPVNAYGIGTKPRFRTKQNKTYECLRPLLCFRLASKTCTQDNSTRNAHNSTPSRVCSLLEAIDIYASHVHRAKPRT